MEFLQKSFLCPCCKGLHEIRISVKIQNKENIDNNQINEPCLIEKKFTRLYTCPINKSTVQIEFKLSVDRETKDADVELIVESIAFAAGG
jgi:hypothetical protein